MAALRSCFSLLTGMGGAPSVTTRAGFSATSREPSASALGDLRVTVRAFRRASPHGPHATTPCPSSFLPGGARGADELVDGPFLRPGAACLPPPSSLSSMAGRLGGTLTFPKWRVRLRCTCACKTPPLGEFVLVSRPKPVN